MSTDLVVLGTDIISQAKKDILTILHRDKSLLQNAREIKITSEEQRDVAEKLLGLVKDTYKEVDGTRAAAKRPFLDGGNAVDAEFKGHLTSLKAADTLLTKALRAYQVDKFNKAQAAQKAVQQIIAADPTVPLQAAEIRAAVPAKTYDNDMGGQTQYKDHFTATVVDESLLPEEYWKRVIDDAKLQADVNGPSRKTEIPGVEISYEPNVASVTAKGGK